MLATKPILIKFLPEEKMFFIPIGSLEESRDFQKEAKVNLMHLELGILRHQFQQPWEWHLLLA